MFKVFIISVFIAATAVAMFFFFKITLATLVILCCGLAFLFKVAPNINFSAPLKKEKSAPKTLLKIVHQLSA